MDGDSQQVEAKARAYRGSWFFSILFTVFVLAGICSLVSWAADEFSFSTHLKRFHNDNAAGAATKTVEYLAEYHPGQTSPGIWFVCALLCLLILAVEHLRHSVEQGQK